MFVKVANPIFFCSVSLSLFYIPPLVISFFFLFFCFSFVLNARASTSFRETSPYGWVLDDFLATRADRRLVVRFRRHRSGATGVRATD